MKPFLILVVALGATSAAHADSLHFDAPELSQRLIEDTRPSFAGALAQLIGGGLLGSAGAGAAGFGLACFIGATFSSETAVLILFAVISFVPGVVALGLGITLMVLGTKKLRGHIMAGEPPDEPRVMPAPAAPMLTVAEF